MVNKKFYKELKTFSSATIIEFSHCSIDVELDDVGFAIELSAISRTVYLKIICLAIRFY